MPIDPGLPFLGIEVVALRREVGMAVCEHQVLHRLALFDRSSPRRTDTVPVDTSRLVIGTIRLSLRV
jgi:hypothetical protein